MELDRNALYVWLGGILPSAIASLSYCLCRVNDPVMRTRDAPLRGCYGWGVWPLVLTGVVGFVIYTLSSIGS
jgi:hypothetical protein